ncbi:hypothetical protein PCANC_23692 [Puccinia coronata f. sp. avenae]|uniref:Fatty acid desaturase domain-containing protein n=1 Tax=Puccinia coronata f. sp. avenae TaxID=200324 RepID=A0A2N5UAL1_9BASI|nr:hypothetical protein PCANC_23692 [Puccinia coronata f. sp. avenae]
MNNPTVALSQSHRKHEQQQQAQRTPESADPPPIWWSNLIFFVAVHLAGMYGAMVLSPISRVSPQTLVLTVLSWQLATFGITIGYHRLWSHKSFHASQSLRCVLALLGCLGFQGSIKWWVLRHRLHHRWTDSEFDPYNSKKGLFFSHMGWIFRKPKYEKLKLIDQSDLNRDPVVRFQHKFYVPLSLFMGFILPYLLTEYVLKSNRHSTLDGVIWAGFVSRILIWHFTFLINSFAHYYGERSFDLDISARSNLLLALFTGGEANHNYHHVFPKDYRNGPDSWDWDPSKWIIFLLHRYTTLVPKINYTDSKEVEQVRQRVLAITSSRRKDGRPSTFEDIHQISLLSSSSSSSSSSSCSDLEPDLNAPLGDAEYNTPKRRAGRSETLKRAIPRWKRDEMLVKLIDYHGNLVDSFSRSNDGAQEGHVPPAPVKRPRDLRILLIDNYLVDVTQYFRAASHPGGNRILERFQLDLGCLAELATLLLQARTIEDSQRPRSFHNKSDSQLDRFTHFERFKDIVAFKDCLHEFRFELNTHSSFAWMKMKSLRIARLIP